MVRFTRDQLVLYLSGQMRPITVPEVPLFLTFNIALVRKGMDASHMGPGLTAKENFDHKLFRVKVPIIALKKEEIKDIVVS